jgi:hypothetical protein
MIPDSNRLSFDKMVLSILWIPLVTFLFFYFFFAEDLQHEGFSGSVFKESGNNNDCSDQSNNQPEDSRHEKSENDQNAPQDGTKDRLLLPHIFCFNHRVHLISLLKKVAPDPRRSPACKCHLYSSFCLESKKGVPFLDFLVHIAKRSGFLRQ